MPKEQVSEEVILKIKLADGKIWERSITDYTSIDLQNLDDDLVEQPGKIAWINSLYAGARLERDRIKLEVDRLEAKLRESALAALGDEKKPTEKAIEAWVIQHDAYGKLLDRAIRIDYELNMIQGAKEALVHRRDSLIALNLNRRREWETDLGKTVAAVHQRELDETYRKQLKEKATQRQRGG